MKLSLLLSYFLSAKTLAPGPIRRHAVSHVISGRVLLMPCYEGRFRQTQAAPRVTQRVGSCILTLSLAIELIGGQYGSLFQ